jgi:plasmid stabilization system protein ParE
MSNAIVLTELARGEIRKAIPRRFPYLILYRSDGETITVIACMHAHRDPQSWMARLGTDDS